MMGAGVRAEAGPPTSVLWPAQFLNEENVTLTPCFWLLLDMGWGGVSAGPSSPACAFAGPGGILISVVLPSAGTWPSPMVGWLVLTGT